MTVFADTSYYIALVNPRDEFHEAACKYTNSFDGACVTTAWVLNELANFLCHRSNRGLFLSLLDELREDRRVSIIPPTGDLFDLGLDLYAERPDKDWSLTDCISFVVMEQTGLTAALTTDRHFEQAGFAVPLQ